MRRRTLLVALASSLASAGCLDSNRGEGSRTSAETATTSDETTYETMPSTSVQRTTSTTPPTSTREPHSHAIGLLVENVDDSSRTITITITTKGGSELFDETVTLESGRSKSYREVVEAVTDERVVEISVKVDDGRTQTESETIDSSGTHELRVEVGSTSITIGEISH